MDSSAQNIKQTHTLFLSRVAIVYQVLPVTSHKKKDRTRQTHPSWSAAPHSPGSNQDGRGRWVMCLHLLPLRIDRVPGVTQKGPSGLEVWLELHVGQLGFVLLKDRFQGASMALSHTQTQIHTLQSVTSSSSVSLHLCVEYNNLKHHSHLARWQSLLPFYRCENWYSEKLRHVRP